MLASMLSRTPVLRLGIHPPDLDHEAIWRLRPAGSLFHIFAYAAVSSVPGYPPIWQGMLTAALSGAIRARGQRRPAPAFLAGWSVALGTATVATLIGVPMSLTTPQTAILAILPGAVIGMIAQERLERSLGFSLAIIWAFCAVAISTMGSSPGVALAAIIGISGMGVVLVRAAT